MINKSHKKSGKKHTNQSKGKSNTDTKSYSSSRAAEFQIKKALGEAKYLVLE